VEGVLIKDMVTAGECCETWMLKLSTTKTASAAFHLKKEAKHELNVNHSNNTLSFCSEAKYLGVTLDRTLTCRQHLESLRKKLTSRIALLRLLTKVVSICILECFYYFQHIAASAAMQKCAPSLNLNEQL